jgi:hypothetical protein
MKKIILSCLLILLTQDLWANQNFLPLPLINRNDKLLNITKDQFAINHDIKELSVVFTSDVRWERSSQNLLLPFVKLRLKASKHYYYRYKGVTYLPQLSDKEGEEFTDIDYSLFDTEKISVIKDRNKSGEITIKGLSSQIKTKTVLMDYSCSGYNLQVSGFEGEFLSIGCELNRDVRDGNIVPGLKVFWISNEYRIPDQSSGPYLISFTDGREAKIPVMNEKGEEKLISIKVQFPKRLHKLRMAGGVGPYFYKNAQDGAEKETQTLPSVMLYGNYYLNNIHSLKFFEALVMKESIFNHAGLYVGSELGKFYDDRLVISSLLGLQALSYRFDQAQTRVFTQIIFPQGIELLMHHPWGLENYRFSVGGFLSPQRDVTYQNFWARFGSKVFLEFNYINWEYAGMQASMYGLSVGFPLGQFL